MTINGKWVKEQTEQKSLPVIHKKMMNGRAVDFIPVELFSMLSFKTNQHDLQRGDQSPYKHTVVCDLFSKVKKF